VIKDIAFVVYPAADVPATRAWYEKMLGLTFGGAYKEDGIEKFTEANVGSGCFAIMSVEWCERGRGAGYGLNFEVDDVDAMAKELRAGGVAVEDIYETPVCKMTSFHDPEGNKVTLHQKTR
jgi:predicted enzyme related to lactoylglutathione lyase